MKSQRRLMKIRAVVRLLNFPEPCPAAAGRELTAPAAGNIISGSCFLGWASFSGGGTRWIYFPSSPRSSPPGGTWHNNFFLFFSKEKKKKLRQPVHLLRHPTPPLCVTAASYFPLTIIIVIYKFTRPSVAWPHGSGWLSPTGGTWCKLIFIKIQKKKRSHAF